MWWKVNYSIHTTECEYRSRKKHTNYNRVCQIWKRHVWDNTNRASEQWRSTKEDRTWRIHINISVITDINPSETQSRVFKKSHFHTLRDRSRRPDYRIHRYCTHNAEKERKKQRQHSKTCVTNEKKKKYYITTKL